MKHEVMARAISELDDELIASACDYRPRRVRAFPRVLAAACLALILTAALTMTRRAPETDILIGGTALSAAPIPIDQPAPMALDPAESAQPLEILLTVEGKADEATAVSVSGGTLSPEADSSSADLSCTVTGEASLVWRIEAPDENARYTLSLDGKAAAVLHYDGAKGCWVAEWP
mgnify:CR=1 FL=1